MMALYHRRLLLPHVEKPEIDNSSCYMCYVCPDYCSNIVNTPILPPPPPPPSPSSSQGHQVSTILVVMLCVLGLALMFLSYLTIRGYRIRSRRNSTNNIPPWDHFRDDENQGPVLDHPIWYIRTVGFPQSVIDTIAVFKYNEGEGLIEGSDCSVCLNEFREDENLRLLPKCSHAFHLPCIDTWLRSHKNCPVCRAPVLNSNNTNNTSMVVNISTNTNDIGSGEIDDQIHDNESEDFRRNGLEEYSHDHPAREISNSSDRGNVVLRTDEDGTTLKNKVLSDLADHPRLCRVREDQESMKPLRRSVSMDFFSDKFLTIHHPMDNSYCMKEDEGCSDFAKLGVLIVEKQHNNLDVVDRKRLNNSKKPRLIKCSSHGLSIQKGPILMERSFSFSGRRSLWKHSKSVESISIPEV